MKVSNSRDFWAGLAFFATGTAFAAGALDYSFGSAARPGPGYLPFGLGMLLAVLGALVLLRAIVGGACDDGPVAHIAWKPLLLVLGSLGLFAFMLPRAGMLISLPLLIFISSMASDEFRPREALASAAVLTAGAWLVFIKGLGLAIPLLPALLGE